MEWNLKDVLKFAADNADNAFTEGMDPQAVKKAYEGDSVAPQQGVNALGAEAAEGEGAMMPAAPQESEVDMAIADAIRALATTASKGDKDAGNLLRDIIAAVKAAESGAYAEQPAMA